MTTEDIVRAVVKEAKLPDGQQWLTLHNLLEAAKRLDNGDKK